MSPGTSSSTSVTSCLTKCSASPITTKTTTSASAARTPSALHISPLPSTALNATSAAWSPRSAPATTGLNKSISPALPDVYLQIVMQRDQAGDLITCGLFVGDDLDTYLEAAKLSRERNILTFDKPLKKIVAVMQADEFRSTWVGNKAVYRTRMALADGGELLILAPGIERFGEQPDVDSLIRKYGYTGTPHILELYRTELDMQAIPHGVAHLIHGSSEGRFTIRYAPGHLTREEIEGVGYQYADLAEMTARYNPAIMKDGWNTMPDGEEVFYISTPSAGLWATKEKLYNPARLDLTGYTPSQEAIEDSN